jgi:hypothetical protein
MKIPKDLIGHNSKTFNKPDFVSMDDAVVRIVKSIINGVLEKSLYFDLALQEHEDARKATRVCDRFEALELLKNNIEAREEPIKLLQTFEAAERNGTAVSKYELDRLKSYFNKDLVDYYIQRVKVSND